MIDSEEEYSTTMEHNEESPPWILPEKTLLAAVLKCAVQDVNITDERHNAIKWVFQPASPEDEWTLPWICSFLGYDVRSVQEQVKRVMENGRGKQVGQRQDEI